MYWLMKENLKIARKKAQEVLNELDVQKGKMVRTAEVLKIVENLRSVDVMFKEFDFTSLCEKEEQKEAYSRYGAAMYVSQKEDKSYEARILLNEKETPEMQRFSLVHELGHLMLENLVDNGKYLFSTHIDMDITSISKEECEQNEFLLKEQAANIFALCVLIPEESLWDAIDKYDSLDDIAQLFGVEKNAVISRLMLGLEKRT